MTVQELIEKLQALPDQQKTVLVNVKTFTQVYGQAQVTPFDVDRSYDGATISIVLPEGFYIGRRTK